MKKFIIIPLLLLIVGCTSTVPDKRYYQLESDFSDTQVLQKRKINNTIFLEVHVADYLDNRGIVYQTGDLQYTTANNNQWLTPLSNQIQQRLVQDLSVLLPNSLVTTQPTSQPKLTITLFIDSFNGSYTGDAIIKGRWIITNNRNEVVTKNFDYSLRLNNDGYFALVKTLSKGWQEEEIELARSFKL